VIVVEQHVRRVLAIADRAVVLRRGTVALSGSATEIREQGEALERAYLPG
jgi:branched-chain amino acid transport system ATP-binding protein